MFVLIPGIFENAVLFSIFVHSGAVQSLQNAMLLSQLGFLPVVSDFAKCANF